MVARENKGGPFRNITKVVSQQRPIKIMGQLEILLIKYSALAYKAVICFVSYALIYIISKENCNYFTLHYTMVLSKLSDKTKTVDITVILF